MKSYKGIKKDSFFGKRWSGWQYITTYQVLAKEGQLNKFLEDDEPLQRLVKNYYAKNAIYSFLYVFVVDALIGILILKLLH